MNLTKRVALTRLKMRQMAKAKFKDPQKRKVKSSSTNSFIRKTASEWIELAKKQLPPKMLFSEFWHEQELCILFSDESR